MLNRLLTFVHGEPAIVNGLAAIVAAVVLAATDVINGAGGEWGVFAALVAAVAAATRARVTPVD